MDRPMTTEELFNTICNLLKEKNRIPNILDYGLASTDPVPIKTYKFDLKNNLAYGGSEGIYLNLWIEYHVNGAECSNHLGTFKTLREDDKSMHLMAVLLADFIIEEYSYVNANLDDFTWEGADVRPADESGKTFHWGYSCRSMEEALKRKDGLLEKYPCVIVRDNCTRKKKRFRNANA